jgi:hypothetical protein
MRRMHLIEIHDHSRFPGFLRDLVTDALQAMWDYGNVYKAIAPNLRGALETSHTSEVIDLCSGGGGPWLRLTREFEEQEGFPLGVCLTDKYPNLQAFERAWSSSHQRVAYCAQAVDATDVPAALKGFRTMFSSFHHFAPDDARRVLQDAVTSGQGVGIFEAAKRCPRTMLLICWVPLMALAVTPLIRPFRWSRLFWTYLLPVVPFVLWFDGLVSCLRTYSQQELRDLVQAVPGTRWEIGEARTGLLPITYLIGFAKTPAPVG